MAKWRRFFGEKEESATPEKPIAWVVHSVDAWRDTMTDILTRAGYAVNAFERFDEAVLAYDYLEKSKKPLIKDIKKLKGANSRPYLYDINDIHDIQRPVLIVSDLYGEKSLFPQKQVTDLAKKIQGKGVGHVIQSTSSINPDNILRDIQDYLASGVPKIMEKRGMDEASFLALAEESIKAAQENEQHLPGGYTLPGNQSPYNGGRY